MEVIEAKETPRTSFSLQWKGSEKQHLMYEMELEEKDDSDYGMCVVHYKYGAYGSRGKQHIKCFSSDHKYQDDEEGKIYVTGKEKAVAFIDNKFQELWAKGYRENLSDLGVVEKPKCPIEKPGDSIYLEWKDNYTGERAFFLLEYRESGYLLKSQGDIGGKGTSYGISIASIEEDESDGLESFVEKQLRSFYDRGYKKKNRPKNINCKIIDPFMSDPEESGEDDDDDDESENDERPARKKTRR